jgi:hypothetical protein
MAGDISRVVSTVKAIVNNVEYALVPGSVTYKDGKKERNTKAADNGDVVYADNAEAAKGMIKFQYFATKDNLDSARQIEEDTAVTVKIFDEASDFQRTMRSGVSLNDSDKTLGPDGIGEFNFEGTPLE